MTQYLYFLFQREITDHSWFFSSRAKKVIHEMPPSHFVDLRLVKTNLDKEGLKFQLEEHAVARILEVWGLLGSPYHCESLLYNNMRWIKKSVFNLNCLSVLHVFKLSIDFEELWKETNQIPAFIIRCLQRVRKVRFTVVKAQIFPTLTYDDYVILISTLLIIQIWKKIFENWCQKENCSSAIPENTSHFDLQTLS